MPRKTENNKKIDCIEKALSLLLRQLKEAKRKEVRMGPYADTGTLETLNDGIKALENIQFSSVDSFESVKELVEVKHFFSRTYCLNTFRFPAYKPFIDSVLLAYVEIEVHVDGLEVKSEELACRGHRLAASEAKSLVFYLRELNRWYFSEEKIDAHDYKTRALKRIDESRPVLEQHRGYKKLLGNLLLLILTAGIAFFIHKACTGYFLFFRQTDSAKAVHALNQTITSAFSHKLT